MRGCHEDDCHSRKGRLWRSRIRVRKAWAGGGGGGTWCRQSKIIPRVYKRELPSQVRWMRQQGVLQ